MNNSKRIIIFLILILFFILLCILTAMIIIIRKEENHVNYIEEVIISDTTPKTVKDVIENHNSEYISENRNEIYSILGKDLYDEKGNSNEDFIRDLVDDLDEFFINSSFYIIDEDKNITIFARRSSDGESLDLIINNNENFYDEIDGRDYSAVENSKIVEASNLLISNPFLEKLEIYNMYFSYIEKDLTNGRELDNGYIVYTDQKVKVKILPNKGVFNLVFMEDYKDKIIYNLSLENRLSEIADMYDDYVFGGLDKGYLGYRSGDFYYFFYENEASIYPYAYRDNKEFEALLTSYMETKDLDNFVSKLTTTVKSYVDFEYDADIQKLTIHYPTRGIKIDIRDNDPKGITLYSNYHFTDATKQLVKAGKIQYSKKDYVNEYEQMRKDAE